MTVWNTPGLTARFQQLVADPAEFAYQSIATTLSQEFGVTITKNAAIAKGKRLKVPHRRDPRHPHKPQVRVERRAIYDTPRRRQVQAQLAKPVELKGKILFEQLKITSCRWPFGDNPPFLFCGHKAHEGSPYCTEHTKIGRVRWQPQTTQ